MEFMEIKPRQHGENRGAVQYESCRFNMWLTKHNIYPFFLLNPYIYAILYFNNFFLMEDFIIYIRIYIIALILRKGASLIEDYCQSKDLLSDI